MEGCSVRLTLEEMKMVSIVSSLRRSESKIKGYVDSHGFTGDTGWDMEIEGAAAELAYCKFRDKYWNGSVNSFKDADQGESVQIRQTSLGHGSLIVREEDNPEHYYVLVTGKSPDFKVCGWIKGIDAKDKKYVKAPNGRDSAYFIPQKDLKKFPDKKSKT